MFNSQSASTDDEMGDASSNKRQKISKAAKYKLMHSANWDDRTLAAEMSTETEESEDDEEYLRSIENGRPLEDKSRQKLPKAKQAESYETDVTVLKRRQKQIDYGKNTREYKQYLEMIPKSKRCSRDIWTPNKYLKYSRRSWDGQIRRWRKTLHKFDPGSDDSDTEDRKEKLKAVMKLLQPIKREPNKDDICCSGSKQVCTSTDNLDIKMKVEPVFDTKVEQVVKMKVEPVLDIKAEQVAKIKIEPDSE